MLRSASGRFILYPIPFRRGVPPRTPPLSLKETLSLFLLYDVPPFPLISFIFIFFSTNAEACKRALSLSTRGRGVRYTVAASPTPTYRKPKSYESPPRYETLALH